MVLDTCNWLEASNRIYDDIEVEKKQGHMFDESNDDCQNRRKSSCWWLERYKTRHAVATPPATVSTAATVAFQGEAFVGTIFFVNPALLGPPPVFDQNHFMYKIGFVPPMYHTFQNTI